MFKLGSVKLETKEVISQPLLPSYSAVLKTLTKEGAWLKTKVTLDGPYMP